MRDLPYVTLARLMKAAGVSYHPKAISLQM
jgi:hypothetical protein